MQILESFWVTKLAMETEGSNELGHMTRMLSICGQLRSKNLTIMGFLI